MGWNKVPYTFSTSGSVPSAEQAKWNTTQTNPAIQQNWAALQHAQAWATCSNTENLGSLLDGIIADIKSLIGAVEEAVGIIAVVASVVP